MFEKTYKNAVLICSFPYVDRDQAAACCSGFIDKGYRATIKKVENDHWHSMEWVYNTPNHQDGHLVNLEKIGTRYVVEVSLSKSECVSIASSEMASMSVRFDEEFRKDKQEIEELKEELEKLQKRLKKAEDKG